VGIQDGAVVQDIEAPCTAELTELKVTEMAKIDAWKEREAKAKVLILEEGRDGLR
jgi:hypothetical protein